MQTSSTSKTSYELKFEKANKNSINLRLGNWYTTIIDRDNYLPVNSTTVHDGSNNNRILKSVWL